MTTSAERLRSENRRTVAGSRVNAASAGLARNDHACRAELRRWVGATWLPMGRYDTISEALKDAQPGDVIWWQHRGLKWVPFLRVRSV